MVTYRNKTFSSMALLVISGFLLLSVYGCKPDLTVEISGQSEITAGSSLDTVTVKVKNIGQAKTLGTSSSGASRRVSKTH